MKFVAGLGYLLAFYVLGDGISHLLPIPVPAGVLGMLLLWLCLSLGWVKLENVQQAGTSLLGIFGLLFVPAGVGFVAHLGEWKTIALMVASLFVIVPLATGLIGLISGRLMRE